MPVVVVVAWRWLPPNRFTHSFFFPHSGLKLNGLLDVESAVEALHDDNNNNKHIFHSDQKNFIQCKPLYERLINDTLSHQTISSAHHQQQQENLQHQNQQQQQETVKILLSGEMPDAGKSLGNSSKFFHFNRFFGRILFTLMTVALCHSQRVTPVAVSSVCESSALPA